MTRSIKNKETQKKLNNFLTSGEYPSENMIDIKNQLTLEASKYYYYIDKHSNYNKKFFGEKSCFKKSTKAHRYVYSSIVNNPNFRSEIEKITTSCSKQLGIFNFKVKILCEISHFLEVKAKETDFKISMKLYSNKKFIGIIKINNSSVLNVESLSANELNDAISNRLSKASLSLEFLSFGIDDYIQYQDINKNKTSYRKLNSKLKCLKKADSFNKTSIVSNLHGIFSNEFLHGFVEYWQLFYICFILHDDKIKCDLFLGKTTNFCKKVILASEFNEFTLLKELIISNIFGVDIEEKDITIENLEEIKNLILLQNY